jgi:hypothetical protein
MGFATFAAEPKSEIRNGAETMSNMWYGPSLLGMAQNLVEDQQRRKTEATRLARTSAQTSSDDGLMPGSAWVNDAYVWRHAQPVRGQARPGLVAQRVRAGRAAASAFAFQVMRRALCLTGEWAWRLQQLFPLTSRRQSERQPC